MAENGSTNDVNAEEKQIEGEIDSRTNSLLEFKQLEQEVHNAINDEPTHDGAMAQADDGLVLNPSSEMTDETTNSMEQGIETVREIKPAVALLTNNEDTASTRTLVGSPPPPLQQQQQLTQSEGEPENTGENNLAPVPASETLYSREETSLPDMGHEGRNDSDTNPSSNQSVDLAESEKVPETNPPDSNATTLSAADTAGLDDNEASPGGKDGAGDANRQTPIGNDLIPANESNEECKCEAIRKDPKTKTKVCSIL